MCTWFHRLQALSAFYSDANATCVYMCIYVTIHVRVCTYACMFLCVCMRVYARTYVRDMLANILTALRSSAAMSRDDLLLTRVARSRMIERSSISNSAFSEGTDQSPSRGRCVVGAGDKGRGIFHDVRDRFCKAMPNERINDLAIDAIKASAALAAIKASKISPSRRRRLSLGNAHRRSVYNKYRDASRIRLLSNWRRLAPLIRPTYITCGKNEWSIDRLVGDSGTHESSQHRRFLSFFSPRLLHVAADSLALAFAGSMSALSVCPSRLIAEAILSPISGRVTLWFPIAAVLMNARLPRRPGHDDRRACSACNVRLFESATSIECCMRVYKFVYRKIH